MTSKHGSEEIKEIDPDLEVKNPYDLNLRLVSVSPEEQGFSHEVFELITADDLKEFNIQVTQDFRDWYENDYPHIHEYGFHSPEPSVGYIPPSDEEPRLSLNVPGEKDELITLFYQTSDPSPATTARHFLVRKSHEKGLLEEVGEKEAT